MPLIGFVNDEGEKISLDDTWKRESFAGLPVEILFRMHLSYIQEARPDGLTVTGLLGCARKSYLQRTREYYANPRFLYAMFRGTMIHQMLEGTNALYDSGTMMYEKRYHRIIPGTTIDLSGKIDKYIFASRTLADYKTIADAKIPRLARELPPDYIMQANIYKWILEGNGHKVDRIVIHFIGWKYVYTSGQKALLDSSWSNPKWLEIPECAIYTTSMIEDFITHRAKDITRQEMPPPVKPKDRWMCTGCSFNKDVCWPD